MDDRRPNTLHQTQSRKKEGGVSAATLGSIFMSAVLGLIYLFAFAVGKNSTTQLTIYFSLFFFMLSASLISDFTSVLIDIRDNYIILPKPVNDRTVVLARILHISIHVSRFVVPMCLPAFIYLIYAFGIWGGTCFLLFIMLLTLFTIFFINALYILILRITSPQKFQSIISYVQIVFAIAIYASYQIIPRMIGKLENLNLDFSTKRGIIAYPLFWFAGGWNTLYHFGGTTSELLSFVLSILVPIASIWIVIKYLATSFNNKLSMINSAGIDHNRKATVSYAKRRLGYAQVLSKLFSNRGAERMGFLFTWKMSTRSRDFRLKVYPGIGYLLVYMVMLLLNSRKLNLSEVKNESGIGKGFLLSALYFCSYLLIIAISQVVFSEKYKAAWIFFITPIKRPGEVISGSIKAAIIKFYIPIVLLVLTAGLLFIGIRILPNILLGLFNELLIVSIVVYINKRYLPFSLHQNMADKSGGFLRGLLVLICTGFIALVHFL
ncbi:MAG TPA: hypothetical protein VM888_08160, partial [Chitinophagaceae bacterium]|nr:hypothetical protein [Chitinophagaceae bacterium]